jgi:hypothetical protein
MTKQPQSKIKFFWFLHARILPLNKGAFNASNKKAAPENRSGLVIKDLLIAKS